MSLRIVGALLLLAASARAQSDDPDEEIARRHFRMGLSNYAQNDYINALVEFEAARRVKAAPAFDFNIARCLDRLERFDQAIVEYESYLKKLPQADDAAEIRKRVEKLRARIAALQKPGANAAPLEPPKAEPLKSEPPKLEPRSEPPKLELATEGPPASRPSWTPSIAVGAVAIALGVSGAGLLGHGTALYNDLDGGCGRTGICNPKDVDPLKSQIYAGGALLGIAAAVAIVDVVLIARTAAKRR
jgi:tetratricopeptide (TPR) repeat protein